MSYKHITFDQSEVLQNFEKIVKKSWTEEYLSDSKTFKNQKNNEDYYVSPMQQLFLNYSESIESVLNTIKKIIEYAGLVPTPWGNPLSITQSVLILLENKLNSENLLNAFYYAINSLPVEGFAAVILRDISSGSKIVNFINKMPSLIKNKIIDVIILFLKYLKENIFAKLAITIVNGLRITREQYREKLHAQSEKDTILKLKLAADECISTGLQNTDDCILKIEALKAYTK